MLMRKRIIKIFFNINQICNLTKFIFISFFKTSTLMFRLFPCYPFFFLLFFFLLFFFFFAAATAVTVFAASVGAAAAAAAATGEGVAVAKETSI